MKSLRDTINKVINIKPDLFQIEQVYLFIFCLQTQICTS